jgi:hypothetical protein
MSQQQERSWMLENCWLSFTGELLVVFHVNNQQRKLGFERSFNPSFGMTTMI